jgi:hypothetical protein
MKNTLVGGIAERALIVLVTTALMLVVVEFALRAIYPDLIVRPLPTSNLAFEFNEDYLIALKSNVRKSYPHPWRTNQDGFRGAELREADLRVMVYGDSNVLARFSARAQTFPAKLEKQLALGLNKDVEVINAGLIGFGPDQSLLKFRTEVDNYSPDLVVFHVFADNDFGDLVRNRLFELNDDGELVESATPRTPDPLLTTGRLESSSSSLLILGAIRSALRGKEPYWLAHHLQHEFEVYRAGKPQAVSHFADHYDADLAFFPDSESAKVKRALMVGVLKEAKDLADTYGVKFLVLIQPSSRDLTTNLSPNHRDFTVHEGYHQRNLTRFVTEAATRHHIPFVDLYQVFASSHPEQLYFKKADDHWNARGQALAAREVARYVLANGLLTDGRESD